MVTLSRIYTRTGDGGQTRLGDGAAVAKADARVEAYGTVDELNAALGLVRASGGLVPATDRLLLRVQNDLFDLGADLCRPQPEDEAEAAALRVTPGQAAGLERDIDRVNAGLGTLRSFVLPGGSMAAAWLHLARTICRRAERRCWALAAQERVNPQVMVYLNRLSDLLFVLAREANAASGGDVLWVPGQGRGEA
jgi:cob(I)alamin adenosyltransferase